MARVIGGSTIGEGCFLDRDVVIGYPSGDELPLLDGDREAEIAGATVGKALPRKLDANVAGAALVIGNRHADGLAHG